MEISGTIKMIGQSQHVSSSFRKRELVVTTDEQYPKHILIEFNQDKCDLLNGFHVGQNVKVSINLRGREWINPQEEKRYFNSIQGWKIDSQGSQMHQQNYESSAVDNYLKHQQPNQAFGNPQGINQGPNQPKMFNGESDPDDFPSNQN